MKDAGCQTTAPLELTVDATAGIGIASRKGAGRIRHIATPTLWLQRLVNDGSVVLSKTQGTQNPADMGTKFLGAGDLRRFLGRCGFKALTCSSELALKAALGRDGARPFLVVAAVLLKRPEHWSRGRWGYCNPFTLVQL